MYSDALDVIVQRLKDNCACFERLFGHELHKKWPQTVKMLIWPNLGQNPSAMSVRTFARMKHLIWDRLQATKAEIIQS